METIKLKGQPAINPPTTQNKTTVAKEESLETGLSLSVSASQFGLSVWVLVSVWVSVSLSMGLSMDLSLNAYLDQKHKT